MSLVLMMRVLLTIAVTLYSSLVSGQQCIDTDGDGWGWDGVNSCIPGVTETSPP